MPVPPSPSRTHAIAIASVGAHAIVIAAIARCSIERPPREATTASRDELAAIEVVEVPVDVELVTVPTSIDPTSPLLEPAGTARGTRSGTRVAAIAGTGNATREPGRGGAESLRMRGRRHDLSVSGSMLDRFLENTKPLEPIVVDPRVRPNGGEHVIHDLVTTVTVGKDGHARFADKPDIDIKLKLPVTSFDDMRRGLGNHLRAWRDDPWRDQRAGRMQDLPRHATAVPGACESLGDPNCDDSPTDRPGRSLSGDAAIIPVVGGKLGITEYLHRKYIGDPFASRKLKLLDSTRDARAQIGATHRSEQRDRAAELAQRNLDALWHATTNTAERKSALFAMWDECSETEDADGAAGERARAIVLGWIRAKLPAGSPDAFTTDEIAKLDAGRTSRQHFTPY